MRNRLIRLVVWALIRWSGVLLVFLAIGVIWGLYIYLAHIRVTVGFLQWSGFQTKTLWDVLDLLIVPLVLAGAALLFNQQQKLREAATEDARQQEDALQIYLDKMTELLLEKGLRLSDDNSEVMPVAKARTITVLRSLDTSRRESLLMFLHESKLIRVGDSIGLLATADLHNANLCESYLQKANLGQANLSGANLSRADLSGANLIDADLRGANLSGANLRTAYLGDAILWDADLSGAYLQKANLHNANMGRAILRGANLTEAILSRANLHEANLSRLFLGGANLIETLRSVILSGATTHEDRLVYAFQRTKVLSRTDLTRADLRDASLPNANLSEANLSEANLTGANLSRAILYRTKLRKAGLRGAILREANLSGADLSEADLSGAILDRAKVSDEQLSKAKVRTLKDATMPDELRRE